MEVVSIFAIWYLATYLPNEVIMRRSSKAKTTINTFTPCIFTVLFPTIFHIWLRTILSNFAFIVTEAHDFDSRKQGSPDENCQGQPEPDLVVSLFRFL